MHGRSTIFLLVLTSLLFGAGKALGHPVPSLSYDRTIRVRLTPRGVEVAYLVDLTDYTITVDIDKLPSIDEDRRAAVRSGKQLFDLFHASIAPILADRIEAWQGDRVLTFQVLKNPVLIKDWTPIEDHLRFTFTLFAPWPTPERERVQFRLTLLGGSAREEFNLERGRIDLAFEPNQGVSVGDLAQAPEALKLKADTDRDAVDDRRLRQLSATASLHEPSNPLPSVENSTASPNEDSSVVAQLRKRGLTALLESNLGVGLLLILAGGFGAAHALTPGHGKTLVAAYLVGQRGTIGHALFLGLVTAITHTGIVILLAALLPLILSRFAPERVQAILGFGGGVLIAALGVWLLLRRLAGGADHVHIGGGHHQHGPGGHHHHHLPVSDRVRPWDLIVLGVSGGIVPCWDAIALLAMAIGTRQIWLGLPLLLAFSAGLAGVLVLIGVLVVKLKGFGSSRMGEGRFVRALPILSAIAVTVLGIWLCFDSVRGP